MTAGSGSPHTGAPGATAGAVNRTIVLDLNRLDELFVAPACNPFAAHAIEVLGQSGVDFLRRHFRRRWPKHAAVQTAVIRLPATLQPATPAGQAALEHKVRAALANYSVQQVEARRTRLKVSFVNARRELLIALVVTVVALALLSLAIAGFVIPWLTNLQYLVTLLAVFGASLAIWDALESLFFDWVPYVIENGADRWLAGLDVRLDFAPAADAAPSPLYYPHN